MNRSDFETSMGDCVVHPLLQMKNAFFVYVIEEVGGNPVVKIGVAGSPGERLYSMQTGNPRALRIAYSLKTYRKRAFEIERAFHWMLKDERIRGEWFSITASAAKEHIEAIANG